MPRSTMKNRVAQHFDAATQLRAKSAPAINATTVEAPIELDCRAINEFKAVIAVDAYTGYAAGSAFWKFHIEASTGVSGTFVPVDSTNSKGVAESIEIALSGQSIVSLVPDAKFIRIRAEKIGGAGNATYGAYLSAC